MTNDCAVTLNQAAQEAITKAFFDVVTNLVSYHKWNPDEVNISIIALALALSESAKDIKAIQMRRDPDEISVGKIAGILTFRLARGNPIHLSGKLIDNQIANKLNALSAFAVSLKHILGMDICKFPTNVTSEIQYTLLRRHTNQETLGLAFDMLDFHVRMVNTSISHE